MFLDTGNYSHEMDPSMRSVFGRFIDHGRLSQFGASREALRYEAPKMALGNWILPDWTVIESGGVAFENRYGTRIGGILGLGALRTAAIDFNFNEGKLRFVHGFAPPPSATPFVSGEKSETPKYLPARLAGGWLPSVDVTVNGDHLAAAIDTGYLSFAGLRTEIFDHFVATGVIRPERKTVESSTEGGTVKFRTGTFTKGNIMGVELPGMPVEDARDHDVLGLFFLMNFNFAYDIPAERLYFTRRRNARLLDYLSMLGAGFLYENGHCRVYVVSNGPGPAKDVGIQRDDIVLRLGPLRGDALNDYAIYNLCEANAGPTIDVEYSRGGETKTFTRQIRLREKLYLMSGESPKLP